VKLLKNGALIEDSWRRIADDAAVPADGPVIVSLPRLQSEATRLIDRAAPLGVAVRNNEPVEAIVPFLGSLALVVLEFPKFTDGRAYSQARTLRERFQFAGELRATGQVLLDQLLLMQRCGFDSFVIVRPDAAAQWLAAQSRFSAFYQPTGDGRTPISTLRQQLARNAAA